MEKYMPERRSDIQPTARENTPATITETMMAGITFMVSSFIIHMAA